jgi:hypothetical protein
LLGGREESAAERRKEDRRADGARKSEEKSERGLRIRRGAEAFFTPLPSE